MDVSSKAQEKDIGAQAENEAASSYLNTMDLLQKSQNLLGQMTTHNKLIDYHKDEFYKAQKQLDRIQMLLNGQQELEV